MLLHDYENIDCSAVVWCFILY